MKPALSNAMRNALVGLFLVVTVLGAREASATTDSPCATHVAGYDPVDRVIWTRVDCSDGETTYPASYARLDLGALPRQELRTIAVRTRTSDDRDVPAVTGIVDPKDRASLARVVPLIALPPDEVRAVVDPKHEGEFDRGVKLPVKIEGDHVASTTIQLALAHHPVVASAYVLPGTSWAMIDVRYGEHAGCCPIRNGQRFVVTRYLPRTPATPAAELRVGPDYLALVAAGRRAQVSLPAGCGHDKRRGRAAAALPFELPCRRGAKLEVRREPAHLAIVREGGEIARIHVDAATAIAIQGEQIVHEVEDTASYTRERVVCTYGGRCAHTSDDRQVAALTGATRSVCTQDGLCLRAPVRGGGAALLYRSNDPYVSVLTIPALARDERVVDLEPIADRSVPNLVIEHPTRGRRVLSLERAP